MKVPSERTLADKQREIVRTWVAPAAEGLSVAGHHEWRESLSPARRFDEVDEAVAAEDFDDINVVDPYEVHAPSRRSDKDLGEFLNLLDSLETGDDRKETTR